MDCEHKFENINNLKRKRTNDGTFYCIPGYDWCSKCGALQKTFALEPYAPTMSEILLPPKE